MIAIARPTTYDPCHPFDVCRDALLPDDSLLAQCHAIEDYYHRATGLRLGERGALTAVRVLDFLIADRGSNPYDPKPIPARLLPLSQWMAEQSYPNDLIYLAIREVERTGTCFESTIIDLDDQAEAERVICGRLDVRV